MVYSPAFTLSIGYPLGVLLRAGLRLCLTRHFQAFLACGACAESACSYFFRSIARLVAWCFFAVHARRQVGITHFAGCASPAAQPDSSSDSGLLSALGHRRNYEYRRQQEIPLARRI